LWTQVIQLAVFASAFYHNVDKLFETKNLLTSTMRTFDILILIGSIYLSFVVYEWWKAILLIVLLFFVFTFVITFIHRFLTQLLAVIIGVVLLLFSAIMLYLKNF
jgi:hypothetical protein